MAANPKPLRKLEKRFFNHRGYSPRKSAKRQKEYLKKAGLRLQYYILVHREIVAVNFFYYNIWSTSFRNLIRSTHLPGGVHVSTVFLGFDHGFPSYPAADNYVPTLFETMIFGGDWDQWQFRYKTYDEALTGHEFAIKLTFEVRTFVYKE